MTESQLIIGSLMAEHRVIERVLVDLGHEFRSIRGGTRPVDLEYIDVVVDFLDTYVGRLHHGKEENIFFLDLLDKPLPAALSDKMRDLVYEHMWMRARTEVLVSATARHEKGDVGAVDEITDVMSRLAAFYPAHMRKEEQGFFTEAVEQFTHDERHAMIERFRAFDQQLPVHEQYRRVAEELEARRAGR